MGSGADDEILYYMNDQVESINGRLGVLEGEVMSLVTDRSPEPIEEQIGKIVLAILQEKGLLTCDEVREFDLSILQGILGI